MPTPTSHRACAGLTLIEILCVIVIIMVLAALLLGPAGRVLQRVRADKWNSDAEVRLAATVEQLQKHFRGRQEFAPVTLRQMEQEHLVSSAELDFLRDRRVSFTPFAGNDPDDREIIRVELAKGYFTDSGVLTTTKGEITIPPR